jgi:hypothetical protein
LVNDLQRNTPVFEETWNGLAGLRPLDPLQIVRVSLELERPEQTFRDLGPNWYAAIMGTGIVANAGAILPLRIPGLRVFATAAWALAAAALIALTAAWAVHWIRYPGRARGDAANPVMAQFWDAPAQARRDRLPQGPAGHQAFGHAYLRTLAA